MKKLNSLTIIAIVVFARTVSFATDTNLMPWLVISSNRLATIQQEFYALPRPIVDSWQTVTQRGPVLFFGFNADIRGTKLVLTTNAQDFIARNEALATNRFCTEEEIGVAIWPILLNTNYSGDAAAVLVGLQNNAFTMAGPKLQATGYISPTNSGSWNADGAEVRKWLRWELCAEWWLDNHGVPVAVPGGRRPPGDQPGFNITNCTDEAASQ